MKTRHTLFGGAQDKDRAFEEKTSLLRIQNTVILFEVDFTIAQRAKRFSLLEKKPQVCVCVCVLSLSVISSTRVNVWGI